MLCGSSSGAVIIYMSILFILMCVCVCVFDRFRLVESIDIVSILNLNWSFDN